MSGPIPLILAAAAAALATLAACGTDAGPEAPPVSGSTTTCIAAFCATHPDGWDVEEGADFIAFSHPDADGEALGSIGMVDMRGLVTAAGGSWPAPPVDVVRAFFDLLGQDQDADLDGDPVVLPDGSVEATGRLEDQRFWYRLLPGGDADAVGVEIRAPNRSWDDQARAWLGGVVVTPG